MPDFQEAMSKVRSLSYLSDEFAAFAVGLSYHGEGASAKIFEEAMPRYLPRNRPVRFDPRSPRQSLAVHARRKLTREGYFKSIKGVGPSGKRDTLFSHLTLAGLFVVREMFENIFTSSNDAFYPDVMSPCGSSVTDLIADYMRIEAAIIDLTLD